VRSPGLSRLRDDQAATAAKSKNIPGGGINLRPTSRAQTDDSGSLVVSVTDATMGEWREAHASSRTATFYHGPRWAEIWEAYTNGSMKPAPRKVEFSDSRTAILGVTRQPTGVPFLARDLFSPAGTYGGWVSSDELGEKHAQALAEKILTARSLTWKRGPHDALALSVRLPRAHTATEVTHFIDLREGADAARSRWWPKARQKVGRAKRAGAKVREASGPADWLAYDAVYRDTVKRWGRRAKVTYDKSFFLLLSETDSPSVRLWLVEVEGAVCAGVVGVTHATHAAARHGVSMREDTPGLMNLLYWEVTALLADEGFHVFDLGQSGSKTSLVRFKESIGAESAPVLVVARRYPSERLAHRVNRRALRRLRSWRSTARLAPT
jgi:GNAT acetyltransferase-like protein